jgi:hypothetical protein
MHFLKKTILLLPLFSLVATSCDNISEDERYITVDQVTPKRAVLLEEFTGQYCRNCPDAHQIISQLKEQYGDSFIPVSIHAGPTANAIPADQSVSLTNQGLKQDEGDTYADMWGITSYPQGVFNRTSGVLSRDKWAAQIVTELQKEAPLNINVSTRYDSASNKVLVSTELIPVENINANLQLWLVESDIVSMQQNGAKMDRKYVHNHVFRTSINSTQGQPVALTANIYGEYEAEVEIKELWVPANLSVVAFVYNSTGVLNAAETAVVVDQEQ